MRWAIKSRPITCLFVGIFLVQLSACHKAVQPAYTVWDPTHGSEVLGSNDVLALWLTRIYGLSPETALVLGAYQVEMKTLKTVLLRTVDDGRSWRDVSPTVRDGTLFGVDFVDAKVGLAYGQSATGDPGAPFFLRTDDGGATWTLVGALQTAGSPAVYEFDLENAEHGVIKLLFHAVGISPERPHRIETHETHDGGKAWLRTSSNTVSDSEAGQIGERMDDETTHLHNGFGWQLSEADGDAWTYGYWVSRSADAGATWQRVARFPRHPYAPN